jgi:hypothetical protein
LLTQGLHRQACGCTGSFYALSNHTDLWFIKTKIILKIQTKLAFLSIGFTGQSFACSRTHFAMPLPSYAKTTIRLAFGSKHQTGKLAHLLFGFSIKIQRCKALPVLAQSKIWHFLG